MSEILSHSRLSSGRAAMIAPALSFVLVLLATSSCQTIAGLPPPSASGQQSTATPPDAPIRTTASQPAINLQRDHVNLAQRRLSLYPLTGAASPGAGPTEFPSRGQGTGTADRARSP